MESSTAALIIKVLDCLSVRSVVTAQNIANAGSPNYQPRRVSFERALAEAAGQGVSSVDNVMPQTGLAATALHDGKMRLDLELATASSTALRYGALVDVLNRQLQLQSLAMGNG